MQYLPGVVFLLWLLYGQQRLPDLRDPRLARDGSRLWAFWQLLDGERWTPEGLKVRRAHAKHLIVGLLLAGVASLVALLL